MPATKKTINSDLEKERRKCTFDIEEFAQYWYGDPNKLEEKRQRGMLTVYRRKSYSNEYINIYISLDSDDELRNFVVLCFNFC